MGPARSEPMESLKLIVNQHSSSEAKVALFRSLFRGREDVYPRRFESRKTGKSGYAPACANEWVRGICEKPRIKCAECPNRRFLSLNERVIRWHLSGHDDDGQPFVAGIYPMLLDETCFFLAIDFDKQNWNDDALRVSGDLPSNERFRQPLSGHARGAVGTYGSFSSDAIPAALARRLGSYVLTETMARRPDVGFESYDRFFPSQDTLPHGGFGNLIALPLQKQAREKGNSVFVDDQLVPYDDQWAFLSTVRALDRSRVEADRRGRRAPRAHRRFAPPDRRGGWRALEDAGIAPAVGAADRGPTAIGHRLDSRQRDLHPERRTEPVASKPVDSPRRLSESRVLQGSSDATWHLRQAAHRVLR